MPKRVELLSELVPQVKLIALLVNPNNAGAERVMRDAQEAARAKGLGLHVLKAGAEEEVDAAFVSSVQRIRVSFVSSPNAEAPMIDGTPSATLLPPARSEPPSPAVPATPREAAPVCDIRITEWLPVQDSRGFSGRR